METILHAEGSVTNGVLGVEGDRHPTAATTPGPSDHPARPGPAPAHPARPRRRGRRRRGSSRRAGLRHGGQRDRPGPRVMRGRAGTSAASTTRRPTSTHSRSSPTSSRPATPTSWPRRCAGAWTR
jgi:hypothetical protein